MCRMVFATGRFDPVAVVDAASHMSTAASAIHEYSRDLRHDDGWGAAGVLDGTEAVAVFRSAAPLSQDDVASHVTPLRYRALVVHARAASKPEQRGLQYVHPIETRIGGDRAWFFHNGFYPGADEGTAASAAAWDSENLLAHLLPALATTNWRSALRQRLDALPRGTTAANCIVLSARRAIICNWFDVNLGATRYYTMHRAETKNAVIVSSEPSPALADAWEPLGHGRIVECQFGSPQR